MASPHSSLGSAAMTKQTLHFGLVIGINEYPDLAVSTATDKAVPNLVGAHGDAIAFADWLRDEAGGNLPEENIVELPSASAIGSGSKRPTDNDVDDALILINDAVDVRLAETRRSRKEARLYLFFAGHGVAPPDGRGALLMANASHGAPNRMADMSKIVDWYERCGRFGEIVALLDCCREVNQYLKPPNGPALKRCFDALGRTAIVTGYACALGAQAFEPITDATTDVGAARRGFFTDALLEGLSGAAAHPIEGTIRSADLDAYIRRRVERDSDGRQSADLSGPTDVVIAVAAQRALRDVVINFPVEVVAPVQIYSAASGGFIDRWEATPQPWTRPLRDGWYQVETIPSTFPTPFSNDGVFEVSSDAAIDL